MAQQSDPDSETRRLEQLWAGTFGDAYTDRNALAASGRQPFWQHIFATHAIGGVLEVGCNVGANLHWIARLISPSAVYGIEINRHALNNLRASLPATNAVCAQARDLPFRSASFDLVFTSGVLIHQPESSLELVMSEIVRCSRRYVLCIEYFAEQTSEIPYRGECNALFKRDYGGTYQKLFSNLQLLEQGDLGREHGWDDVRYWFFRMK